MWFFKLGRTCATKSYKYKNLLINSIQVELLLDENYDQVAEHHHVHQGGGPRHSHHPRNRGAMSRSVPKFIFWPLTALRRSI